MITVNAAKKKAIDDARDQRPEKNAAGKAEREAVKAKQEITELVDAGDLAGALKRALELI